MKNTAWVRTRSGVLCPLGWSRPRSCVNRNAPVCPSKTWLIGRDGFLGPRSWCGTRRGLFERADSVVHVESMVSMDHHIWSHGISVDMIGLVVMCGVVGAGAMYGYARGAPNVYSTTEEYEKDEEEKPDVEEDPCCFGTSEDIWKEAWRPIRECHDGGWVVQGRPLLWVDAISEHELGRLMVCSMTELEKEVVGNKISIKDGASVTSSDLENLFVNVAGRVAETWLGYTPHILSTNDALGRAISRNKYHILPMMDKMSLYMSVLRLLCSDLVPDGEGAWLIPGRVDLRSWSIIESSGQGDAQKRQSGLLAVSSTVIQDMAISIADMVCAGYLHDVTIGLPSFALSSSSLVPEKDEGILLGQASLLEVSLWPSLLKSSLRSTRDVQNFTNKLYFYRFLDEYYFNIVSIYEDKLGLFRMKRKGDLVAIDQSSTRMRRAHELSQLQGVKYIISLGIEGFDFVLPCMKNIRVLLSKICSWILRDVLGKGLGHILEGANVGRQSRKKNSSRGTSGVGRGTDGLHPSPQ